MSTDKIIDDIIDELKDYIVPLSFETRVANILNALKPVVELIERDVTDSEMADDTENYDYAVKSKFIKVLMEEN